MARRSSRPEVFLNDFEQRNSMGYLRFPDKPFPHSILLVFKQYEYRPVGSLGFSPGQLDNRNTGRFSGVGLRSSNSVELPFPKQLQDGTSLRINSFERDPMTEIIANKINNYLNGADATTVGDIPGMLQGMGAGMAQALSATSTGAMGAAIQNTLQRVLGTSIKDVGTAAQYLLRKNLPGDISRTVDNVTGQTLNPRETLAFEGVNLRTHNFNWDLYPSNQQDSEKIRQIVNMIKKNSLPGVTSIEGIPKAFLQYPSTVDVYLVGVNKESWMKFKTSMITSFTVDYGAGGMGILKGGKPAGVNISLGMTELEIETSIDYGGTERVASLPALSTTQPTALDQSGPF